MSGQSWLRSLYAVRTCSQRNPRGSIAFRPWLESLEERSTPASLNLTTIADDTLYEVSTADPSLQLSNGAGQHFYVGRTSEGTNDIRRGAIKFDLSAVPAGSTITSATLTLNLSKTRSGAESIALHRTLASWGEGASNAGQPSMGGGGEGAGTAAKPGDVTWFYTVFSTQKWNTPGGDFVSTPSASTSVAGVGSYQWSGA
ncbi:MAG TPA: DNRLRE domain-containing protein, partial [Gemmataceae bacterium]|nr:DNRLRE domain-containing protein [Gemmataceae bacterium]